MSIAPLNQQNQFPAATTTVDPVLYTSIQNQITEINALAAGTGFAAGTVPGSALVANSVLSAELDPQTIQYATITPTLAQMLAMYTTGIPLVAAQGAGTFIEFISMIINLQYGSAAFSGGAAVGAYIGSTAAGTLVSGTLAATIFTTFSANKIATAVAAALGSTADASGILNTGLVLSCPTQVFTGGTGSTSIIKVAYRVHSGLS